MTQARVLSLRSVEHAYATLVSQHIPGLVDMGSSAEAALAHLHTAITSVSMIGHAAASSIGSLLSWRLLLGVGNSSSWSGSSAYMQDLSDKAPDHRGTILGFQQATIGSVWIVGPAIGGFCAEAWGLQNSFIIAGVGSALCSLGYRHLPETLKLGQKDPDKAAELDSAAEPDVRNPQACPCNGDITTDLSRGCVQKGEEGEAVQAPTMRTLRRNFGEWRSNAKELCRDRNQQVCQPIHCERIPTVDDRTYLPPISGPHDG